MGAYAIDRCIINDLPTVERTDRMCNVRYGLLVMSMGCGREITGGGEKGHDPISCSSCKFRVLIVVEI